MKMKTTTPARTWPVRAAVLGGDVSKSRSPAIHTAAFRALGLAGAGKSKSTYVALSIDAAGFAPLVARLSDEGYAYINVTIPHKRAAALAADSQSSLVRATLAANTLIFRRNKRGTTIRAENTDGVGLLAALADLGLAELRGRIVVMVGAGGAASGALWALVGAGAAVVLVARRPAAARALRARLPQKTKARVRIVGWTAKALSRQLMGAAVLISAVPAAAWHNPEITAGLQGLSRDAAVLEMAYGGTTPLAAAVRPLVARYQDGLPMLVHQAAAAVKLALGRKPEATPLLRAARNAGHSR